MSLTCSYNEVEISSYLNFEVYNKTYPIMDLEEREYDSISFKTDLTKQAKTIISMAIALNTICSPLYASLEKERFDTFDNISSSYIEQRNDISSSYSIKIRTWIDDFIIDAKNLTTPADLLPYYSKINNLMIDNDFESYDKLLNKINIKELNETLIIALLRLSFVWKNELNSWNGFLGQSIIELENRGHNSKKLLVGLI